MFCIHCGTRIQEAAAFCVGCGSRAGDHDATRPSSTAKSTVPFATVAPSPIDDQLISTVAGYEKISAIVWLVIGILQVLGMVTIVAGIWNIYAAITRFKIAPLIAVRDERIPAAFESIVGLIVVGVINLLLGGVIGVLFVAFDFYIRHLILENRHLFTEQATHASALPV